ncbi:MAG TPA: ATPase [Methylococcus sp.]|nr:ATPase [Methylococcus sp.]
MSIARLCKITLYGLRAEKRTVLGWLQELGCLHLTPLKEPLPEFEEQPPERPETVYQALRYLGDCPRKRRPLKHSEDFDLDRVVEETLLNRDRSRELCDLRDLLLERIGNLEPWGNFELPDAAELGTLRLWFYQVPVGSMQSLLQEGLTWQSVHVDSRFHYVVVISEEEPPMDAMPVPRIHIGGKSLADLREELEEVERELEDLQAERESLTRWLYLLRRNLAHAADRAQLRRAERIALDAGEVFAIQGWIPLSRVAEIQELVARQRLGLLLEEPKCEENPPILLQNPVAFTAAQALVEFYQLPGYWSWDPSPVIFFSFALFAAMILSDAGYAALFGVGLALGWRRLGGSTRARGWRVLATVTVGIALLWGVLVGVYFGETPEPGSFLAGLQWIDMSDFDRMMRISLTIGVLHLVTANLSRARQERNLRQRFVPLGWTLLLLGGLLYWLLPTFPASRTGEVVAQTMMVIGAGGVFLFSGDADWRTLRGVWRNCTAGLMRLWSVSRLFGDVLSYLRLFALGLAGSALAVTFNGLARTHFAELAGPGLLVGLLVLLAGHSLNLALGIMSCVVHGLRLNYIEFYAWGISGEGRPFRAFARQGWRP